MSNFVSSLKAHFQERAATAERGEVLLQEEAILEEEGLCGEEVRGVGGLEEHLPRPPLHLPRVAGPWGGGPAPRGKGKPHVRAMGHLKGGEGKDSGSTAPHTTLA